MTVIVVLCVLIGLAAAYMLGFKVGYNKSQRKHKDMTDLLNFWQTSIQNQELQIITLKDLVNAVQAK